MSIQARSVFFDNTNNIVRFWDWAIVTTTLGTMAEPFVVNERTQLNTPTIEFDPTDEMVRIDNIRAMPVGQSYNVLSGDDMPMHGGEQMPRDGR